MKPRISDMTQSLQIKFAAFSARMAEAGIPFALNCVVRTPAEQQALYAQGREDWATVNKMRNLAGMSPISWEENKNIVTKTLASRHFPDEYGKSSAFDIMILRGDKKPTWDTKYDGNENDIPDYQDAARIGQIVGLNAGGLWKKFQDWCHFEEFVPKG